MELSKSDVVLSLAGRDQGMLFFVVDTDGVYVSLVNGKERKLENPKRKKAKHVRKVLRPDSTVAAKLIAGVAEKIRSGQRVLNSELRRELAVLGREFNVSTKEGSETWQKTT